MLTKKTEFNTPCKKEKRETNWLLEGPLCLKVFFHGPNPPQDSQKAPGFGGDFSHKSLGKEESRKKRGNRGVKSRLKACKIGKAAGEKHQKPGGGG